MGETRSAVGEREESQRTAHARGELISNRDKLSVMRKIALLNSPAPFFLMDRCWQGGSSS